MTQPEALRLADELERVAKYDHQVQAAAELRRLYGLAQELLAELYVYRTSKHLRDVTAAYKKAEGGEMSLDVMKQALAALENSRSYVEFDWVKNQCSRAITALRAAIDEAQPEQERQHDYRTRYDRGCYKCGSHYCPANCQLPAHLTPPAAESGAGFESLPASPNQLSERNT